MKRKIDVDIYKWIKESIGKSATKKANSMSINDDDDMAKRNWLTNNKMMTSPNDDFFDWFEPLLYVFFHLSSSNSSAASEKFQSVEVWSKYCEFVTTDMNGRILILVSRTYSLISSQDSVVSLCKLCFWNSYKKKILFWTCYDDYI